MSRHKRPVVMDGELRFESMMDAARYLKRVTCSASSASFIGANICEVVRRGRGTVYGHEFADDVTRLTPVEMDGRIAELEALVRDMVPYVVRDIGSDGIIRRAAALLTAGKDER